MLDADQGFQHLLLALGDGLQYLGHARAQAASSGVHAILGDLNFDAVSHAHFFMYGVFGIEPDLVLASTEPVTQHIKIAILKFCGLEPLAVLHLTSVHAVHLDFSPISAAGDLQQCSHSVGCCFFLLLGFWGLQGKTFEGLVVWVYAGRHDAGLVCFLVAPVNCHHAILHFQRFRDLSPGVVGFNFGYGGSFLSGCHSVFPGVKNEKKARLRAFGV